MNGVYLGGVSYGTETEVSGVGMAMENCESALSVLCAEVSGNARLHEKLGSAEALRAVDRCLKRMERSVESFGGRIVKSLGNELMAVFQVADEAFQSAIEMQQRVADLPPVSGVKLAIRIGFSHGPVSEEDGSVEGETVITAAHLAGLAKTGQILTNFQTQAALSPSLQVLTRDLGPTPAKDETPAMIVFEIVPAESLSPKEKVVEIPVEHQRDSQKEVTNFCLHYAGKGIILDEQKPVIYMGRDADSDVVIHDRRGSRHHAKIERRGDRIVLIDKSTNGTFVTLNGKPELFLRRGECVLQGKGRICFAASASSPEADCAEFEQI
jgi:class 3 adenylate cyclase